MADETRIDADDTDETRAAHVEDRDGHSHSEESRRKPASPLWYAVALALAVLAVLWFLLHGFSNPVVDKSDLTTAAGGELVPNVVGMTSESAIERLTEDGYRAEIQENVDPTVPEGTVTAQVPLAGVRLVEGSTVVIEVAIPETERVDTASEHPPYPVAVPDVVGLGRAPAVNRIESRGYVARVSEVYSAEIGRGKVVSQRPRAGVEAIPGSTVAITVSLGPSPAASVPVPDVTGLSRQTARRRIEAAGLTYYEIPRPEAGSIDRVFDQWPEAGSRIEPGGEVQVLYGVNP